MDRASFIFSPPPFFLTSPKTFGSTFPNYFQAVLEKAEFMIAMLLAVFHLFASGLVRPAAFKNPHADSPTGCCWKFLCVGKIFRETIMSVLCWVVEGKWRMRLLGGRPVWSGLSLHCVVPYSIPGPTQATQLLASDTISLLQGHLPLDYRWTRSTRRVFLTASTKRLVFFPYVTPS